MDMDELQVVLHNEFLPASARRAAHSEIQRRLATDRQGNEEQEGQAGQQGQESKSKKDKEGKNTIGMGKKYNDDGTGRADETGVV